MPKAMGKAKPIQVQLQVRKEYLFKARQGYLLNELSARMSKAKHKLSIIFIS
jgi:hypothetical protein